MRQISSHREQFSIMQSSAKNVYTVWINNIFGTIIWYFIFIKSYRKTQYFPLLIYVAISFENYNILLRQMAETIYRLITVIKSVCSIFIMYSTSKIRQQFDFGMDLTESFYQNKSPPFLLPNHKMKIGCGPHDEIRQKVLCRLRSLHLNNQIV